MFDKLDEMFFKQLDLQEQLHTYPIEWDEQYIKDMILACQAELIEILNETPWKPWKQNQELNKEKYKEEIVDLMHFVINLCIVARITPIELYELYLNKNKINKQRHQEGY